MKLAESVSAALLKAVFKREAGKLEEARQELAGSMEKYTGLKYSVVKQGDAASLMMLLGINDSLYPGKCLVLARMLAEEAEISAAAGGADEARDSYAKSLMLYMEALKRGAGESKKTGIDADIRRVIGKLEKYGFTEAERTAVEKYTDGVL